MEPRNETKPFNEENLTHEKISPSTWPAETFANRRKPKEKLRNAIDKASRKIPARKTTNVEETMEKALTSWNLESVKARNSIKRREKTESEITEIRFVIENALKLPKDVRSKNPINWNKNVDSESKRDMCANKTN